MKLISLVSLIQKIAAFSADIREVLAYTQMNAACIPSASWPCAEESFFGCFWGLQSTGTAWLSSIKQHIKSHVNFEHILTYH